MLIALQECLLNLGWEQCALLQLRLLLELLVPGIQVGGPVRRRNHLKAGAGSWWLHGWCHCIRQAVRILEPVVLNFSADKRLDIWMKPSIACRT